MNDIYTITIILYLRLQTRQDINTTKVVINVYNKHRPRC